MNREEKELLQEVKSELFKEYSAREYRKAFFWCMKNRKKFKTQEDVNVAVQQYLENNHEKNKCWKNKL